MMREFSTGATRNSDTDKLDYEGFLSPLVLQAYAEYMHKNRLQADGTYRDSDNWQKGIPLDAYMKSAWRHFMDVWMEHRGFHTESGLVEALCALLFNVQGYMHEVVKQPSYLDGWKPEPANPGEIAWLPDWWEDHPVRYRDPPLMHGID